ncbi:unnamed protein product [Polarella glacialis]|uniref:Uncharacterized protein n=1 Tax=Polarella glacialis TaxID=89957 RepID=A0A813KIY3_POLGL|nr:unnamed protein product [Polarella glacialis]
MEEPHDASFAELQKRISQVVKKVLQEELQEVKDLLVCLLRQQSKKTQSTAPKPERCKRLAPAVMPRKFTDQSGNNGQPVALEQLQDKHAEWLQEQHAEWSDVAAASLNPKTSKESGASSSMMVIPVLASHSNRAPAVRIIGDADSPAHSLSKSVSIIGDSGLRAPAHSLGKAIRILGGAESLSEGHLRPPFSPVSAPCAPSPDGLQSIHGPPVPESKSLPSDGSPPRGRRAVAPEFLDNTNTNNNKRSSSSLAQIWAARDDLLGASEADCVMSEADAKKFKNDPLREASLSRYGQCMSMTAQVLFKLFGILTFQGRAGYLLPAMVNLILLWVAIWPLVRDGHMHRQKLWSAFNGALMCLGMVMALCCLRRTRIQKLVAPECCPLRLYSQWISTIPSDLLAASVFLMMQFSLTSWYLSQAKGQQCENYDSWTLQLSHVVAAAVFAVLMFLKLHVLSCLDLMIDDSSRQYAEFGDAEQGILRWSLIQTMLDQASNRLEGSELAPPAVTDDHQQRTAADLCPPPGCPHLTQM